MAIVFIFLNKSWGKIMVSFKNDFQKPNTIKINYILIFYIRKITTSIYILMPLRSARWRALAKWQWHKWRSRRVTETNAIASASEWWACEGVVVDFVAWWQVVIMVGVWALISVWLGNMGWKQQWQEFLFCFFFYWVKPQPHPHPVITEGGSVIRAKAH